MKLKTAFFAAALLGLSAAAFGADPTPAAGTGAGPMQHEGYCKKNASECQDKAAQFDAWCSANADKCVALKAHVEKVREFCSKDAASKQKCEDFHKHMRARMKKHCAKDPSDARCKAMKDMKMGGDDMSDDMSSPPAS